MTVQNYEGYNQLVAKFGSRLAILAFPCGQFFNQEPGKNSEILNCVKYVRPGNGYIPRFHLFEKINVNGDPTQVYPLYNYLKSVCAQPSPIIGETQYMTWEPIMVSDITWNFEKFLIDSNGRPFKRYNPTTAPLLLSNDIELLLRN
eukprot:TRINITY_DN1227_c0_g1_i1.p1 TRINITY_DN1227_c0_g1~~TRINITY_DN1227_c0_g1_i1.p1  ORF type:complete len:146 (-),score=10.25 TRINITY_DN1227_c0_g1_i1:750-1187(-)